MRNIQEIRLMLEKLESQPADTLEDQELDFKQWNFKSIKDSVNLVIEMAVCMANGGGGNVVFGIDDKKIGLDQAIKGISLEIDVNRLKKAVYDSTDPKIMPVFEELAVPYGTHRLLGMQIYPGLPPYTDTSGRAKIRIGKDCQPLTGTIRSRIIAEMGESDFTAERISGNPLSHISPNAMEQLRDVARREHAPEELLQLTDIDLIVALGLIKDGELTRAGLFLTGKESSIKKHLQGYVFTYLQMQSDRDYTDRIDGRNAIPIAINRVLDRIMAANPITTIQQGMFHFEYRIYPEIALREAIMNAFCHADYRIAGPILVKQYQDKLEIGNPGGFIGGISPQNILHHGPVSRNPHMVEALTRLRLVNRSNLGIHRMYHAMLVEGKEPPLISELGQAVSVTFLAGEHSADFRAFVTSESKKGNILTVDQLLILQYLLRYPEIETATADRICQRKELETREILNKMETELNYIERGGTGRGTYWKLNADLYRRLSTTGHADRASRINWEAAKTRILSILKQRLETGQPGLSNAEIRKITLFNRNQVFRLMRQLKQENLSVELTGKGRYARWQYQDLPDKS